MKMIFVTIWVTVVLASCTHEEENNNWWNSKEVSAAQCQDKKDNDRDGKIDCKDKDCKGYVFCSGDDKIKETDVDSETLSDTDTGTGDDNDTGDPEPVECANAGDCQEGEYCDLTLATPVCLAPPSGQGEHCAASQDCSSYDANYCESMVSGTCLMSDCSPELNNCSPGYICCDFTWIGLPALCVDETLSGGICNQGECTNSEQCADGNYCDLTLAPPSCLPPPSGQGRSCTDSDDCSSFQADYCESMVSGTCLMQGCSPELNNCSPGYICCDFAWIGLPALCIDEVESGGVCSQGACTSSDDCADGSYCDLTLAPPSCLPPPSGQGKTCADASDCSSFQADYCESMVSGTCLKQGCDKNLNDCSPGYMCCDFQWIGLPALCVDEVASGGHCACSVTEDCREGEYCDSTLEVPVCMPTPADK